MSVLSSDAEDVLSEMYDSLEENVIKNGKKTIWEFIFNVKNNKRYSVFFSSSKKYIPGYIESELKENQLIQDSLNPDEFIITAEGVVYIELIRGKNPLNNLTKIINDRFFTIEVTSLSDKEKIILFSLVMLRCFSEVCCIDGNKDSYVTDCWMQIFIKSESELNSLGIISSWPISSTRDDGVENPMSNIIRHTDSIAKKVKMLYQNAGKHQHYLNLVDDSDNINLDGLKLILKSIFENKLKIEDVERVSKLCNDAALLGGSYVFDMGVDNFSNFKYDMLIRDLLEECAHKPL